MSRQGITSDPHAGFDRPGRRSRPRTKDRPSYEQAIEAMVVTIDRGRYRCLVDEQDQLVTATKARNLGRKAVIVGDRLSSDILGGINAGIKTCWFNPKRLPGKEDIPADYEIHALSELPELLEKI